jgi:caffeoyl-CoA O-methyltransferase
MKCRYNNLPDNTDDTVSSMLIKLPSEFERGNISLKDGRLLYELIIQKGYNHGLEIGTSNGYSALWQGLAFKKTGGRLLTIEIDSVAASEAHDNFRKAGLDDVINLKIDDAKNVLDRTNENYDFVFVDTGDSGMDFFSLTYPFVRNGGTIVIHNVNKKDPKLKAIIKSPDLDIRIKSHLFYKILICTKTRNKELKLIKRTSCGM